MAFGGAVKLTGESEYKKALSQITSELKVMGSQMELVTATYGKNDTSIEGLTAKNSVLNDSIEKQKAKINTLKEALLNSQSAYGENSTKTLDWKTKLNKAETELVNMNNEVKSNEKVMKSSSTAIDNNAKNIDSFAKNTSKATAETLSLGDIIKANLISEGIIGGVKALGSAMQKLGSTFIDVGKQALSSYADYEQLSGGVETLFKGSSGIVENYANNAYKTAGLSANAYMETVTSFSASLLQSLNGDTAKSAQVADMAITDMSDNANKMGTDMSSIQTTYQGFAKQNYTMLDNLKLGYGGTKEEMQRLLSDATKFSGVKYDISNLNDVYQAIHVVQGELGITGTTAKEASTTIQGSVASMKTAWGNMLTGMANENADFSQLVDNLVESVLIALKNIIPRISTILKGIIGSMSKIISQLLPDIMQMAIDLITQIANTINANLPVLLDTATTIINTLINGIITVLPTLIPVAMQMIMTLINAIINKLPTILQTGITVLVELIKGIAQALPDIIPAIVDAVVLMVETIIDNIDLIIDAGIQIILGLTERTYKCLTKIN